MTSLLIVNYRSARLAAEAIRSARATSSTPLRVVVVDNSCDPAEGEALRQHADVWIESKTNRGYAGGINDGWAACDGEVTIVSNPDVTFAPGALDLLVEATTSGAAVAGPAFFWDDALEWRLPPSERRSAWAKASEVLAGRSRFWAAVRDRRATRRRIAFWSLRDSTEVKALSGAVLAIRRDAFSAAGGFDERFALYFEEDDFIRRVRSQGGHIVYVPAARCRHLYNQSAGQDVVSSAAAYGRSEHAFFAKWYGRRFAAVLLGAQRRGLDDAAPAHHSPLVVDRDDVVVEASPMPSFLTAAGRFASRGRIEMPAEVVSAYRGGSMYLRAVERKSGRVLATRVYHLESR